MADSFNFELVSPERLLVSTKARSVIIPGSEGEMTVMANHAPTMAVLKPGVVTVEKDNGETARFVLFGGFVDVLPSGCTILAESAVDFSAFDRADLERRIEEARSEHEASSDDDERFKLIQLVDELTHLNHTVSNS